MTGDPQLPDAAWCSRIGTHLAQDAAFRDALKEIGTPLFVKLKQPAGDRAVILRLAARGGDGAGDAALTLHPDAQVSEEGIIVSTDLETWGRLLRGATDLTTAVMGRDVRATGSMFRLMRIADPAERVVQAIARAMKNAGEDSP